MRFVRLFRSRLQVNGRVKLQRFRNATAPPPDGDARTPKTADYSGSVAETQTCRRVVFMLLCVVAAVAAPLTSGVTSGVE